MNKGTIIHVIAEAVVMLGVVLIMSKRISALRKEVETVKQLVSEQDQRSIECMKHIQQLYGMHSVLQRRVSSYTQPSSQQPPSTVPTVSTPPTPPTAPFTASEDTVAYTVPPSFSPQQIITSHFGGSGISVEMPPHFPPHFLSHSSQHQQSQQQQQQPRGVPNVGGMMNTLLNIIPTMMPLMVGGGGSSENIIKQMEKQPAVSVVDESDDDDLKEALQEALHSSSTSNHTTLETIQELEE
jgi:hypothetical protein